MSISIWDNSVIDEEEEITLAVDPSWNAEYVFMSKAGNIIAMPSDDQGDYHAYTLGGNFMFFSKSKKPYKLKKFNTTMDAIEIGKDDFLITPDKRKVTFTNVPKKQKNILKDELTVNIRPMIDKTIPEKNIKGATQIVAAMRPSKTKTTSEPTSTPSSTSESDSSSTISTETAKSSPTASSTSYPAPVSSVTKLNDVQSLYRLIIGRSDLGMKELREKLEQEYPDLKEKDLATRPITECYGDNDIYKLMGLVLNQLGGKSATNEDNTICGKIKATALYSERTAVHESWHHVDTKDTETQQFWADVKALKAQGGIPGIDQIATRLSHNTGWATIPPTNLRNTGTDAVKKRVYEYLKTAQENNTQLASGEEDKFDIAENVFFQTMAAKDIKLEENLALLKAYYKSKKMDIEDNNPFITSLKTRFSQLGDMIDGVESRSGSITEQQMQQLGNFLKEINPAEYQKTLLRQELEAKECHLEEYLNLLDAYNQKYAEKSDNGMGVISAKFPDLVDGRTPKRSDSVITLAQEESLLTWLRKYTPSNTDIIENLTGDIFLEKCGFEQQVQKLKQFYQEKHTTEEQEIINLFFETDGYLKELKNIYPRLEKVIQKVEQGDVTTVEPPRTQVMTYVEKSNLRGFFLTKLPDGRDTQITATSLLARECEQEKQQNLQSINQPQKSEYHQR